MDEIRCPASIAAPFVDWTWLARHRSEVVVADARWYLDGSSARTAYESGHIPGAVFVDHDAWLSGEAGEGGLNPLPDPAVFAQGMSSLGIGDDTTVVAYDDAGGVIAARLVWMLRALGRNAALLDGGLSAWVGPLEAQSIEPTPAVFTPSAWPEELIVGPDQLQDASITVIDARNPDRFDGTLQVPSDPRPGHISGAVNVPCRAHLNSNGQLKPMDEIRDAFASVGVLNAADVVSYCGSGVTACHNLLTLEHAGLGIGRLYPGGWSEYALDPNRPAATTE
ncbi:sulfurtransferase [Arthrobacter bambusae]|uniref:Thiosulfate/3-mercaptopyruvate sulfurtransferase n=1 Tax=Arthrobacter bambusae TaxID=1338426 RepID=A0AAW8D579_9MICC|nr:sulfurtransferase [Arthrobacter bambusae]MDP9903277.1 thiosulfate/3-mercaptopyruvate sulfurtransferase [Arthrobacter bambusae]MDQ0128729.1 thiosulfate/3-mercaptopyruvate sulfurtransferase [Arthrobacter bambusae]MDQ0180070.1 thiosulfate/3-mercaptopyruvate sulfurtransferase [Arthrobacter bambusae]